MGHAGFAIPFLKIKIAPGRPYLPDMVGLHPYVLELFLRLRELNMKNKETMKAQAAMLKMEPFDFVYRLIELKDQECRLLKKEIERDK